MPPDSLALTATPLSPLLERTLGPNWRCLTDAVIRAGGEAGPVDLVALHPRLGVVLVAFIDDEEEASPDEAVAALRTMLREYGWAERFSGQLNVAALMLEPCRRTRAADAIRAAAGDEPAMPPAEAWLDWLAERLTTIPPDRVSEPERVPAPELPRLVAPRERILLAQEAPAAAKPNWPLRAAAAIVALAPVLAAIYLRG